MPGSLLVDWFSGVLLRSVEAPLRVGGPMEEDEVGVMSMGSRGGARDELDEGRMGIERCMFGL